VKCGIAIGISRIDVGSVLEQDAGNVNGAPFH